MSARHPVEQVRERARIEEVAARYTKLTQRGGSYFGLCPLHDEKTPSFSVSPSKGLFYCFGCGEGGDVFSLVQQVEGVSFAEAVSLLAEMYNVEAEVDPGREALETAWRYMEGLAEEARQYLRGRGIEGDFEVGYDDGAWVKRVDVEAAERMGIIKRDPKGRYYSPFKGRVVFPVRSAGMLVGLTGRATKPTRSKWFHSHFSRNKTLFGLDAVRRKAMESGYVVVVEGPLDAVKLWAADVPAVAVFGSSVSARQGSMLAALGVDVYLGLDRDAAGMSGIMKALHLLRGKALTRVVVWGDKHNDPGEMSGDEIRAMVGSAIDPARFVYGVGRWKVGDEKDRLMQFLSPWLKPVSESDPIPAMLSELLLAKGVVVKGQVSSRRAPPPKPRSSRVREDAVRLLEADIAAVVMSVHDAGERGRIASYVEVRVMPEPGELLAAVLDAMRSSDPLSELHRIGAGGIFYRRILEAPEYSPEEAWGKVRFLVRTLSIKKLQAAMSEAQERGDFEAYMEHANALEAVKRGRRDAIPPNGGIMGA